MVVLATCFMHIDEECSKAGVCYGFLRIHSATQSESIDIVEKVGEMSVPF